MSSLKEIESFSQDYLNRVVKVIEDFGDEIIVMIVHDEFVFMSLLHLYRNEYGTFPRKNVVWYDPQCLFPVAQDSLEKAAMLRSIRFQFADNTYHDASDVYCIVYYSEDFDLNDLRKGIIWAGTLPSLLFAAILDGYIYTPRKALRNMQQRICAQSDKDCGGSSGLNQDRCFRWKVKLHHELFDSLQPWIVNTLHVLDNQVSVEILADQYIDVLSPSTQEVAIYVSAEIFNVVLSVSDPIRHLIHHRVVRINHMTLSYKQLSSEYPNLDKYVFFTYNPRGGICFLTSLTQLHAALTVSRKKELRQDHNVIPNSFYCIPRLQMNLMLQSQIALVETNKLEIDNMVKISEQDNTFLSTHIYRSPSVVCTNRVVNIDFTHNTPLLSMLHDQCVLQFRENTGLSINGEDLQYIIFAPRCTTPFLLFTELSKKRLTVYYFDSLLSVYKIFNSNPTSERQSVYLLRDIGNPFTSGNSFQISYPDGFDGLTSEMFDINISLQDVVIDCMQRFKSPDSGSKRAENQIKHILLSILGPMEATVRQIVNYLSIPQEFPIEISNDGHYILNVERDIETAEIILTLNGMEIHFTNLVDMYILFEYMQKQENKKQGIPGTSSCLEMAPVEHAWAISIRGVVDSHLPLHPLAFKSTEDGTVCADIVSLIKSLPVSVLFDRENNTSVFEFVHKGLYLEAEPKATGSKDTVTPQEIQSKSAFLTFVDYALGYFDNVPYADRIPFFFMNGADTSCIFVSSGTIGATLVGRLNISTKYELQSILELDHLIVRGSTLGYITPPNDSSLTVREKQLFLLSLLGLRGWRTNTDNTQVYETIVNINNSLDVANKLPLVEFTELSELDDSVHISVVMVSSRDQQQLRIGNFMETTHDDEFVDSSSIRGRQVSHDSMQAFQKCNVHMSTQITRTSETLKEREDIEMVNQLFDFSDVQMNTYHNGPYTEFVFDLGQPQNAKLPEKWVLKIITTNENGTFIVNDVKLNRVFLNKTTAEFQEQDSYHTVIYRTRNFFYFMSIVNRCLRKYNRNSCGVIFMDNSSVDRSMHLVHVTSDYQSYVLESPEKQLLWAAYIFGLHTQFDMDISPLFEITVISHPLQHLSLLPELQLKTINSTSYQPQNEHTSKNNQLQTDVTLHKKSQLSELQPVIKNLN